MPFGLDAWHVIAKLLAHLLVAVEYFEVVHMGAVPRHRRLELRKAVLVLTVDVAGRSSVQRYDQIDHNRRQLFLLLASGHIHANL